MLQISEIVKKTEGMFDLFNKHFYNMKLTRPVITVSPDSGRGAYGWCSIHEIWNASGEKYREINLCAEYLDRPMAELAATLLHEMAYLYNLEHAIQDVSNNGYYHNMKFKAIAEAHGLHIEKQAKYGWTVTTLAPEAEAWITATLGEAGIHASRLQANGSSKGGRKHNTPSPNNHICHWPANIRLAFPLPQTSKNKRIFFEKRLAFTPKMYKLSLTKQAAKTKYNKTKGGKNYEDRKNHS